MAVVPSISDVIAEGRVVTYLSANAGSQAQLFGGNIIKPVPPIQMAMVTDGLEWGYDGGAQSAASLLSVKNYAIWLFGMFGLQAQEVINGPGGGSVVPTPPSSSLPNPFDFQVSAISSPLADGDTTVNLAQYIGYNVDFIRNGVQQNTTNTGSGNSFYSWNRTTGDFTISPAANTDELFRIVPIG